MPNAAAGAYPVRAVLENVPEIGYHVRLCPFAGSLEALLRYIGDPADYDDIMGITGACFRRIWSKDDGGNVDLSYLAPGPYDRIFRALGYEYSLAPKDDKAAIIELVRSGIARGRPVISFGPIGPPEAGLITGYDDNGETLIGWGYFQDRSKPGYFELPGWFEQTDPNGFAGAIDLGERRATRPSAHETLTESLKWAIELALVADRLPGYRCGLAGYDAWADGLEVDEDYPAGDDQTLGIRSMVHGDQCVMLHERGSAASYLRRMREVTPEVGTELAAAAGLYEEAAAQGATTWRWGDPSGQEARNGLQDPAARRAIAAAVRVARAREAEAVAHLRRAVFVLDPAWRAPGEEGAEA